MRFDWAISAGTIIQIITLVTTIIAVAHRMSLSMVELRKDHTAAMKDITEIKANLHELKKDIVEALEKRVRDLEIHFAGLRRDA